MQKKKGNDHCATLPSVFPRTKVGDVAKTTRREDFLGFNRKPLKSHTNICGKKGIGIPIPYIPNKNCLLLWQEPLANNPKEKGPNSHVWENTGEKRITKLKRRGCY